MKKNSKSFLCTNKLRTYLFWLVLYFIFNFGSAFSQDRSGLWVGEVLLGKVAEVSVPLDQNNIPRAPDPDTPTETSDLASLKLIIHVDSAGVFRLLKDVAILKRNPNNLDAVLEGDISLITDPSLYSDFPGQFAQRIASATFDFGDEKATEAVTAVMDNAVSAGIGKIQSNANASKDEIKTAARTSANTIISNANVDKRFDDYLKSHLTGQKIEEKIANGGAFVKDAGSAPVEPFNDNRIIEMVESLNSILSENISDSLKLNKLHNTAASFVDSGSEYERFLSGYYISQMIQGAAEEAATQKIVNSETDSNEIIQEINKNQKVQTANLEALTISITLYGYNDTRGKDAIDQIISDIANFASLSDLTTESALKKVLMDEGMRSLRDDVKRYPMPSTAPSSGYNSFIKTGDFAGAAELVSEAVASAIREDKSKTFSDTSSQRSAAKVAAAISLQSLLAAAARVNSSEILMTGSFPNRVSAEVKLPAMHPTNPFRHRRNPDHVFGFDISRNIELIYEENASESDVLQGIYKEEIFGLHKPLGPQKNTGLKVEGTFKLYRVSNVKTLNAN